MKRSLRHLIAVVLTAVMALSLSIAAMASETEDNAHFIFTDISEDQPDLYVTKTVSSAVEGYTIPDATFTFVLRWDKDGDGRLEYAENEIYYVYNEDGTQVWNDATSSYIFRTSSSGQFTLKAGQYARFEWAGQVEYEITELGTSGFTQTEPAGGQAAAGTVDENGTYVVFENLYIPDGGGGGGGGDTTQLAVRKDISWLSGYEMPDLSDVGFTFRVTIDGSAYANEVYTIYDSSMTTEQGTGRTDSSGEFTITGGQLALFEEVEVGVDYKVEEVGLETGWSAVGTTSYEGATTSPIIYAYFTNTPTAFTVEKERADGVTGTDGGTFTFKLTDESGNALAGVNYYLYDANGKLVTDGDGDAVMQTIGVDGLFTLESGQKVVFFGIGEGTAYKIEEVTDGESGRDFNVTPAEGYEGTAGSSQTPAYEFVNEELTDITITKYGSMINIERNVLAGAEFTIYVLGDNGEYTEYPHFGENGDSASLTTGEDGKVTFSGLPAGTYKIVETRTPAGYIATGEPIVVTLPYSLENETEGAVYSERDGVYYLYSLDYAVDNTATLVMPNTGGNAWIFIVLAVAGGAAALISVSVYRRRNYRKEKVRA